MENTENKVQIINPARELEMFKHFNLIAYGSTGSGKTFYLQYLLLTLKYSSLYILCGGWGEDYDFYKDKYPVRDTFDYEEIKLWADGNRDPNTGRAKSERYILILDDIMGMGLDKGANKTNMEDLYSRFRHQNVCCITVTHHLKRLPPCVRSLANVLITTKFDKSVYEVLEETGSLHQELSIVPIKELIRSFKLKKHQYAYFDNSGKFYKFTLTS